VGDVVDPLFADIVESGLGRWRACGTGARRCAARGGARCYPWTSCALLGNVWINRGNGLRVAHVALSCIQPMNTFLGHGTSFVSLVHFTAFARMPLTYVTSISDPDLPRIVWNDAYTR
jgi:hypothetical protein